MRRHRPAPEAGDENGTVYRCAGRKGVEVVLLGSHFTFRGFASNYSAMLPAGATGTWHGRFVVRGGRGDAQERKPSERAPKPARETDEIPSLEELAAMLEGLDG